MIKKTILASFLLSSLTHASTGNNDVLIPEGKLVDYPNIYHDVTPSAGPRVINGFGLFLTGDYIYWTARQDNMQYASTGYTNNNLESPRPGSAANLKYQFQTGFKAGLGFSFGHDLWDLATNYTWFQSNHNKGSIKGTESSGLIPSFTPYVNLTENDYFTKASAIWRLHFNVIDIDLGRNFYISKYLSLRPFVGLKGSWQNQHYNSSYEGILRNDSFSYLRKLSNSFWGIGIRSGCNTAWHLAGTWSIFADTAISALWSQAKTNRVDTALLPDSTPPAAVQGNNARLSDATITPVSQGNNAHSIVPVLELALGIRKDQWFYNNRFHVAVQAGWEEQVWWNQNQFAWTQSISLTGNLVLQGLTARIRLDF